MHNGSQDHAVITGEPAALKGARRVRAGGHWKRTCTSRNLASGLPVLRHTKGPAALRLQWRGGVLRIGAWDASPVPPPYDLVVAPDAEAGRGLGLVRACADDWGWHPLRQGGDTGKYVWCDLGAA